MTRKIDDNSSDVHSTGDEIEQQQIDLLCPRERCRERNDVGSRYCAGCGTQLLPQSMATTQPLPQLATPVQKEQAATPAALAQCHIVEELYESSDSPDAWYQVKVQERAAKALQEIILLMNAIHSSSRASAAQKGVGINEERFWKLNELRDSLEELEGVIRIRMLGEISDHLKVIDRVAVRLISQEFKAKKISNQERELPKRSAASSH